MTIKTLNESTIEERRMLHEALTEAGPAYGYAVLTPDNSPNGVTGYTLALEAATIDTARRSAIGHPQPRVFKRRYDHNTDAWAWDEQKVQDE